jgi:hypothetical protein
MRASSLSNSKIIDLLNRYFVPVYASTTQVIGQPYQTEPEHANAEVHRIWADFQNRKLGFGTVYIYILRPDGSSMAGLYLPGAANPDILKRFLTSIIHQLGTTPGAPVIQPRPQSIPPASKPDDLVTHLVAHSFVPPGTWTAFPSENWIVLTREEWVQLLPSQVPQEGDSWQLAPALTRKLLTHFYPQTGDEEFDADRSRIDEASLRLTITKVGSGVARARFDGKLRMKHSFFYPPNDHEDHVEATLTGFLDFDSAARQIQRMRLITDHGTYMGAGFGAALNSVSPETLEALMGK